MQSKPDENLFREVHRKVREVRDKAREAQGERARLGERPADDEAKKQGLDRPETSTSSEDGSQ